MTSEERHELRYQRRCQRRQAKRLARSIACGSFEEGFSFSNLFQAGQTCCKNVNWKCSTQRYRMNIISNTAKTHAQLMAGTYKSRGFYEFDIYDRGKWRHIRSVHITERAVQRNLCDQVITKVFQPAFIYDNAASIKGKGIDFAMDRLNCHLQRHFRKHGLKGGILVFDFKDYFGSAQHWTVKNELARRVHDPKTRKLANDFLENFGPVGYGLGSQISQNAALMLPNKLDHIIKEELRIKGYGRYMDDGYLIHEDIHYLEYCLERIKEVCACVSIPVIANGDIASPEDALRCRAHSGASLFMVGRAAFGDPWLLGQISAALTGAEIPARPALPERMDLALRQISLAAGDKGEHIACLEARKHLAWYLRGVPHSSFYKDQISRLSTMEEVCAVVKAIKRDLR